MKFKNAAVLAAGLFISGAAFAGPVVSGFNSNTLAGNDDGSTGLVNIGFTVNFFGNEYSRLYVNNNGNVTFDYALGIYTPFELTNTNRVIIAPFFADVDTRYAGSPVTYGVGEYNGQSAFGVNWVNVDYYASSSSHTARNSFQLILVDRSDIDSGDFDIVFNYDSIQWETGTASNGSPAGLGGYSARVGWSNGTGGEGSFFELAGSAVNGAFLNGGSNALAGKTYTFEVRNGIVSPPIPTIPEPETWAMLLAGLGIVGAISKRRRQG
ncbi:MAG: PEP-CTERM sorting domain-containing protein [Azoarcus sp.]|jgi:hypothetical protein|nr:PEP-CTERM sorting domain-containing protein [Azoarcus sp.]